MIHYLKPSKKEKETKNTLKQVMFSYQSEFCIVFWVEGISTKAAFLIEHLGFFLAMQEGSYKAFTKRVFREGSICTS